jgi:tryptophan-rich sensory protein
MYFLKSEKYKKFGALLLFILACESVGIGSALFTTPSISTWYQTLAKPALQPPSWIFGPVWTTLYLLMGIAAFLVWNESTQRKVTRLPLALFGIQLGLNFIWSFLFFNAHALGAALLEIILLWLSIVACIVTFSRISKPAALLLVPYLGWVSFAAYLSYAIFKLN